MKNFKFPLFLLAVTIAIGLSFAATAPAKNKFTTYFYNSSSNQVSEMQDRDNWNETSITCTSGGLPCAINYSGSDFTGYLQSIETVGEFLEEASSTKP